MSATMMMNPTQQLPHRKPIPGKASYNNLQQPQQQQPAQQYAQYAANQYSQARVTSNTKPSSGSPPVVDNRASSVYSLQPQPYNPSTRRTLSNATSSSTSTGAGLQRAPTTSTMPRRSTSSRSNSSASPTSYVALMRKQKATVWCDRAQHEDPRILAAQRAAKMRAAMEVAGGSHHGGRVSTSSSQPSSVGIRSKIRHHGAPKASTYSGANMSGAGVPMRLSASEVDEENDSDDEDSRYMNYHQRNGSGRSSLGSGRANNSFLNSNGSTPASGHSPIGGSMGDLKEEETPVSNDSNTKDGDYFQQSGGSGGSGDSAEAEQSFGKVGRLPQARSRAESQRMTSEELRRRGSVDDRTMTMSGVRLFVANPDLSD